MELIQVKKTFVLQDTSVMGFLLCHTIFLFEYGGRGGGESYLTKEELWVRIW